MAVMFRNDLNDRQFEGVTSIEGPVLVLAGAGSGKTRMLTYKFAFLVHEVGIAPSEIMAVTFTNKAANEMLERVESLLGHSMKANWMGTFHSLCGRILRKSGDRIGIKPNFIIFDEDDCVQLAKQIVDDMGFDTKQIHIKKVISAISSLKHRMISPEIYSLSAQKPGEKNLAMIYEKYENLLAKYNAVDFDNMICHTVRLLENFPDEQKKWEERFQYILVDEFQDTNEGQLRFLLALTKNNKNITVVGDDDQSIYSWRGAQVKNILDFPKYYKDCKIIRLEKNYRSKGLILYVASELIKHNFHRHPKTLYTDTDKGEPVEVWCLPDDYVEAKKIVNEIENAIFSGVHPGELAILYRVNALSRLFEEELSKRNIPYVVVGGVGFYQRAEIKDALAYLRLIANPADDIAFKRIVNNPRRGIGETTIDALISEAEKQKKPLYQIALEEPPLKISSRSLSALRNFCKMIEELKELLPTMSLPEFIETVLEKTEYIQMLKSEDTLESQARLENLGQLIMSSREFEHENPGAELKDYLASTVLATDVDRWKRSQETVNLMTIHSAKGLEFESVFIVGLELGLFPLLRTLQNNDELEEERRLFYVALTRAKNRVFISFSRMRSRFGSVETTIPSPFLDELPANGIIEKQFKEEPSLSLETHAREISHFADTDVDVAFSSGMKVSHPFFGDGVIHSVKGKGENAVITVNFPQYGLKKLVAKFSHLKKI